MNKQRQILVTITYNDLGCIIDTKAEPYEDPNLQPICNQLATDCISRQAAIGALAIGEELLKRVLDDVDVVGNEREKYEWGLGLIESYIADMKDLPSAQPSYTDEQIQKMQDLEQAELEKAFELGREDAKSEIIRCENCKYGDTKPIADGRRLCNRHGAYLYYCSDAERRTDD